MREFRFDPPLTLAAYRLRSTAIVRSLDDAAEIARTYANARRPVLQDSVLRQLQRAGSVLEQQHAAVAFKAWIKFEGLTAR
jgi:hypothetical protein